MLATIGYEKSNLSDFVATLRMSDIEVLVDIRDRAQSRRPGFSKTALAEALALSGIGYLHYRELGDPKEGRDAARSGDMKRFRQVFGEVLASDSAKVALDSLVEMAANTRICLMCYERDQRDCHRKIVADHLETRINMKTEHLGVRQDAGKFTNFRRVHDTYKGAAASI